MIWVGNHLWKVLMLPDKRNGWGFLEFGQVEVSEISLEINSYYEQWNIDTTRQQKYQTHQSTKMFQIMGMDYYSGLNDDKISNISNKMSSAGAQKELEEICKKIEEISSGKVIRIEFINMKPRSRVRTHKDRSDILYVARRFHIPIKTNPKVFFKSGDSLKILKPGNLYELNNINYHSVINSSDENRIHLIIDSLPIEYCENLRIIDETS